MRINEIRASTTVVSKVGRPSLITWKGTPAKVKKHIFSLDEEMGFSRFEKVMYFGQTLIVDCQGRAEKNGCGTSFPVEGLPFLLLNLKLKERSLERRQPGSEVL